MSARGLVAKPTTRQVIVHIRVFLYQGYDIRFIVKRTVHHTPALICGFSGRKKTSSFFFGQNIARVKIVP